MGDKKRCYSCMENYESYKSVCPYCGYDENSPYNPMYIAPGTILHERYMVGVLLGFNGEGATYTAYDQTIGCKVLIREYVPINLCTRVKNKPVISVNYNNLAKYKAFMVEFTELNKSLARFRNNTNIIPAVDMFAENNTTYTVYEHVEGISLLEFLKDNAGELSWEQVSKLFPQLFTTIGIIHNAGITHRAISPETIYVTEKGELKLSAFCISAVRTANAGLEYELFKGYAAPEQYSASTSSRQGSWTDVYGVCALLYRVLTGCMPTEASSRMESDNLCEPNALNRKIPPHVSRVIMEGMNISRRDRIQTITELVTKLFEQPTEEVNPVIPAAVAPPIDDYTKRFNSRQPYDAPAPAPQNEYYDRPQNGYNNQNDYQNPQNGYNDGYYDDGSNYNDGYDDGNQSDYKYEKVSSIDKFKIPIIIGVLLFAILMVIIVAILGVLSPKSSKDESTYSSAPDNIIEATTTTEQTTDTLDGTMLDLTGKYFDITQQKYADVFKLEATYEYNDDYENGQIFEQDIAEGESFKTGETTVHVKVSKGSSKAKIPDYSGCSVSQYEALLQGMNIKYQLVEDTSSNASANTVTKIELNGNTAGAGDQIDIATGERLMVYYSTKAAETEAPTTTAHTEATQAVTTVVTQTQTEQPTEPPTEKPTEQNPQSSTDSNIQPQQ